MSLIGTRIGHLMIVDELGVGGMGQVYVAFDDRLQRQVALKAVRRDRLDEEMRARFLREARILSQLRHPNICTIHGFLQGEGEVADLDFLVLELVDGETLRQVMDGCAPGLELDARLRRRIAEALVAGLAAAHARGIVHRDLKPENVMVHRDDHGGLEVKILDFGLAQVAYEGDGSSEDSGSPPPPGPLPGGRGGPESRRSPDRDDKSPASDSGSPLPGERARVRGRSEVEADSSRDSGTHSRPDTSSWIHRESSRVRTSHGSVYGTVGYMSPEQSRSEPTTIASDVYSLGLILQELYTGTSPYPKLALSALLVRVAQGQTEPARGIDGDLAKLLEAMKSPLPEDRPSMASVGQRLRWIAGKRRRRLWRLGLAALVLLALAAGVKYTVDLQRERNAALAARSAEEASRRQAERVVEFLVDLFEGNDPRRGGAEELTARELLARGSEDLRQELEDDPGVRALLIGVVGEVHCRLGLYDEALPLLEESLDDRRALFRSGTGREADVAESLDLLGRCHWEMDDYDRAEPILQEALLRAESAGDPEILESVRNDLGLLYWRQAKYEKAAELLRTNLAYFDEIDAPPRDIARTLNNLAEVEKAMGHLDVAESLLRRALRAKEDAYGSDHATLASTLSNLGDLNYKLERYDDAERDLRRALAINLASFGRGHSRTVSTLNNLASVLADTNRLAESLELYLEARAIVVDEFGPQHLHVGIVDSNLGEVYAALDRFDEAERSLDSAYAIMLSELGPDHPHLAFPLEAKAEAADRRGEYEEAKAHLERALAQRRKTLAEDHPLVQATLESLERLDAAIRGDDG